MPSPELTPPQSTLLQTMNRTVSDGLYQHYFQATFEQERPASMIFFCHGGKEVMTIRGALIDFLALVQHGDIALTHQEPTSYWGYLIHHHAPA